MAAPTKDQPTPLEEKRNAPQQTDQSVKYTDGESDEFEFGGSLGAALLMISFPLLMWYMWIGATYYDGQFPVPNASQTWRDFGNHLARIVYEDAYPTAKAWAVYWGFFVLEAIMFVTRTTTTQGVSQD
jgi:delta24(24(1))-sterol reductase